MKLKYIYFLNNGLLFNLLVLLDLSQYLLFISIISSDHFNIAFNYYVFILCISFDLFDMKYNLNEHVQQCFDLQYEI